MLNLMTVTATINFENTYIPITPYHIFKPLSSPNTPAYPIFIRCFKSPLISPFSAFVIDQLNPTTVPTSLFGQVPMNVGHMVNCLKTKCYAGLFFTIEMAEL